MYWIDFNNKRSIDLGLYIPSRIAKPTPEKDYEEKKAQGKDGNLYIDKGYKDIEFTIPFAFIDKEWDRKFRGIKRWINKIDNRSLKFSDDLHYFYKVKKATIVSPERILKKLGKFEVKFTCYPLIYRKEGSNKIRLNNNSSISNLSEISQPIFYLNGEGYLNLYINNNLIKINVSGNVIIDTEKGLCYGNNGEIVNKIMIGYFEDMYFKEGKNSIRWDNNNISVSVVPNWRCF